MLGLQEGRVYNTNVSRGLSDEYLKLPSKLPSLDNVYTYFSSFLNAYSSTSLQQGKLKRTLLENLKNNNYLLELKLEDLFHFQNVMDTTSEREEESITKQLREANNEEGQSNTRNSEKLPPFYVHELVKVLTQRPLIYLSTIERVCYDVCRMNMDYEDEKFNYIQINLLNNYASPTPIRSLLSDKQETFVVVPGIIVQANRTQHKMRVCTIQCRYCGHKMVIEVPLWISRPQIPKTCRYSATMKTMGENIHVDQQLGCHSAQNPYVIIVNECQFVDVQLLKMQELAEDVPTGDMPRHLQLNVTRYLCDKVIPGDRIYAHGVLTSYNNSPNSQTDINSSYLHVLGIQKLNVNETYEFDIDEGNDLLLLASQPDIHTKIFNSIAPSIYGLDDVKKACACALFGGTRKEVGNGARIRGDINILILGDPSIAKSQILKFVDFIAPISIYTSGKGSSAAGLTAAVVRDSMGVFSLEGGAMVLADGGVVCIDEFDKMRPDDAVAIHEAMEQQTISISKAGITTILNTRCSVIAAANPNLGSYNNYQDNNEQHDFKTTILSRFDLIFMLKDNEDVNHDRLLCKHILSLHNNQNKHNVVGPISNNKLRRFIQYSKQVVSPILSNEAKDSLRNFYVQKRKEYREDKRSSTKKIPITLRQLESLVRISESLARMELSPIASEKHVQMAIQLFIVSTGEAMKSTLNVDNMSLDDQQKIKMSEELILSLVKKGQRTTRRFIIKELQKQYLNMVYIQQAINILIKKGVLQERGDLSLRRCN
ncbi:MCM2/3/5 family protein [Theileria parva strain Muguga]|uniref:DNA helicase n=1 Tax=Theileria parva TaxID=5875 RepID=Q4N7U8_THEPA|nr:MCM2/3/5 family protein [Theileria parva strain Muguga]EAN33960.1 MCM2/3/5 family protein [Theileria parva strain Muguga]|eukprot:XP_766243.1 DNA replication licensing factor MCM5 [Theileria parva strain Muguga]